MTKAPYVPEGWPVLVPRIGTSHPEPQGDFIQEVFGAGGSYQSERPTELHIGDSMVMVSGSTERDEMPAFLYVYVEDADSTYRRAVERGAASIEAASDMPYGDRRAMVRDEWGNIWQIATPGGRFTP